MASASKSLGSLGATRYARKLIKSARRAAGQIKTHDDDESLHRFRIRVRRLRAFLKTYREPLGGKQLKKPIARLGKLIDLTNTSRDLQVQLIWLDRALTCRRLKPRSRDAARWMTKHFATSSNGPSSLNTRYLNKQLCKTINKLNRQLTGRRPQKKDNKPKQAQIAFDRLAGKKIRQVTAKLSDYLSRIDNLEAHDAAHRARLAAKQLRYILEPMRKSDERATDAVREVKRLQDLLGELRDRQVLETELLRCIGHQANAWSNELKEVGEHAGNINSGYEERCMGLRDLVEELRHQQAILYRRLERNWLKDQGRAGMQNTLAVAETLCYAKK